jgi:hypothetical protein
LELFACVKKCQSGLTLLDLHFLAATSISIPVRRTKIDEYFLGGIEFLDYAVGYAIAPNIPCC